MVAKNPWENGRVDSSSAQSTTNRTMDDPFLEDQFTNQMNDSESDEQPYPTLPRWRAG
jgi:hypothetical protein